MTDKNANQPDEINQPDEAKPDVDELEKELLDAMRNLGRKNKKIEEYLGGLAKTTEKPTKENTDSSEA